MAGDRHLAFDHFAGYLVGGHCSVQTADGRFDEAYRWLDEVYRLVDD